MSYYILTFIIPCLLPLPHISASLSRSIDTLLHGSCNSGYHLSHSVFYPLCKRDVRVYVVVCVGTKGGGELEMFEPRP